MARVAALLGEDARARSEAPLTLAVTRTEAGVTFERFDIPMAALDAAEQLVQGDVLAAADELLHAESADQSALGANSPQRLAIGPRGLPSSKTTPH